MINQINFKNYKSFKDVQELEFKPITILIGKNSSGKSAVAKLSTLIEGSLSENFEEPLLINNGGIDLGAEFRDLVYGREAVGSIEFELIASNNRLSVEVTSGNKDFELPRIRKWRLNDSLELLYDDIKKQYHNERTGSSLICDFNGFKIDKIYNTNGTNENVPDLNLFKINLKTNYIGPFRQIPERIYNIIGTNKLKKIGIKGENAYQILISDYLYNEGKLLKKVDEWYKANFDGWGVDVNATSRPDYKVELTRDYPKFSVNIKDVGQGMSQALPLVVSAFMNSTEDILTIIEQPELHLHPAAHGSLAELFALATINSLNHFLIETHSQNFILRLRRLVAEGKINKENIIIYSVEYDEDNNTSNLKKIKINEFGEVDYWPENVFSETLDETLAIRMAQLNKRNNGN